MDNNKRSNMEERNYGITKRQMSLIGRSRKYDIEILSRALYAKWKPTK